MQGTFLSPGRSGLYKNRLNAETFQMKKAAQRMQVQENLSSWRGLTDDSGATDLVIDDLWGLVMVQRPLKARALGLDD